TRALGALTMLPVGLNTLAHVFVLEGDLPAAASALAEARQVVAATGSSLLFLSIFGVLAALRGDEGAAKMIDGEMATARDAGLGGFIATALWARALLRNGMGRYQDALVDGSEAMRYPVERAEWLGFPELIEAAVRCGQTMVAAATLDRLAEAT